MQRAAVRCLHESEIVTTRDVAETAYCRKLLLHGRRLNSQDYRIARAAWRNSITFIAGCCARAASGHTAAKPATILMKSRRLMSAFQVRDKA